MCRFWVLMMLAICLFTFGILALTVFPDQYLPLISTLVCGSGETLRADMALLRAGESDIYGYKCVRGDGRVSAGRDATLPTIAVTFAPTVISVLLMIVDGIGTLMLRNRILQTGDIGVGRVVGVGYTGVRVNNQPVYEVGMMVYTHSGAPYEAKTRKRAGLYGIAGPSFGVGSLVPLRIDRDRPQQVIIDDNAQPDAVLARAAQADVRGATGVPGAQVAVDLLDQMMAGFNAQIASAPGGANADLSERLRQLKDAYDQGLITQDEYAARRQRLLDQL